ncbi:hypothetical protein [Microbulbifer spongiae]|uniref:Uncharacterized protein n=1 Tax=Microbulbifer spongiae TaxID=2944933 RepID=A0ABY9E7I1_9GAMM|nr:hypothetical protein [Microbulbifer sp. MI-G]WKD48415.1 hypothetical protein M8T91_10785 [Microbulbifer sp. MI-G]
MHTQQPITYEKKRIKNSAYIFFWTISWGATFVVASAAVNVWWPENIAVLIAALATNISLMICVIIAHWKWLKDLDDLQRQIQLYSMAFTLSVTWLITTLLILLEGVENLPIGRWHSEILVVVMSLSLVLGNIIGMRKAA